MTQVSVPPETGGDDLFERSLGRPLSVRAVNSRKRAEEGLAERGREPLTAESASSRCSARLDAGETSRDRAPGTGSPTPRSTD